MNRDSPAAPRTKLVRPRRFIWARAVSIARKEMRHLSRDPFTLGMALGVPVFLVLFFGYVLDYDVKQVKHLNLESHEVVASPWFYMQPNDIVYVMPRTDKIDKEERKRNIQTTASLIISGLSLLTILLSRINN